MLRKRELHFYLVLTLFVVYLINGVIAIPKNSITSDEMDHWSYAKRILMRKTDKIYPYDDAGVSPFHAVNAIPRAIQQIINPELRKSDGGFSDLMNGRYVNLLVCIVIGLFIYRWSKELFGKKAGLLSLFMFVFCPNLNANITIFTGDAYTALFLLSTLYYFWKFVKDSGRKNFLLFSFNFGIALIIKYSLIHLFVIIGLLSLMILVYRRTLISRWKINLLRLVVFLLIQFIVVNAAFQFNGTGQRLKEYHFRSALFRSIQASSMVTNIPLPLPVPYIEGFDATYHMMELGAGHPLVAGKNYLFGEMRAHKGFWYYYIVVMFFKTPIPYLLLLSLAAWLFIKQRKLIITSADFIIVFAGLYYLLVFSFINQVQIGIRHVILLFPLLYVFAGRVAQAKWNIRNKNIAFCLFTIYTLATFYFYFPNLISYTNEFIPDKKNAYKILADTNLDYGQGEFAAERYLAKHKDVKYADTIPSAGKLLLPVRYYLGISGKGEYSWLRNFKPVGHVNHSNLLFDIKEEDLQKLPIEYLRSHDKTGQ